MKKLLALAMAFALVLSFAACGEKKNADELSYDDYNLEEYIEVGEYKGLKVNPYTISVSEDEIKASINEKLESAKEDKPLKDGQLIKDGDTTVIDYVGKLNGEPFENGSDNGKTLVIGSNEFIDGFETGLIGKKVGATVDVNVTFPTDYGSSQLAGKPAVFTVTINSATRPVVPTKEEFVKNDSSYNSVADFEKDIKKSLKTEKEAAAIKEQKGSLWSELLSSSKLKKAPQRELNAYKEFNSKQVDAQADMYQISREEVLKSMDCSSEEEFDAVNEDSCKLRIKQEMMIEYIAKQENISCSEDEIKTGLDELIGQGYTEETIYNNSGRSANEYVRMNVLYEKVLDLILNEADVTGSAKAY